MEIHIPHIKTWREFFIELGTIVIGILIALGLEQLAEVVHDQSRVALARENIRSEIADDFGLMITRDQTNGCISHRLDEVDVLIRASAAGTLPQGPIWIGVPFQGAMADSQYTSATQSGAVSLMPNQEQSGYARIYAEFEQYHQAELLETSAWADLRTLENHPANSPVLDWQLRSAMQQARTARFHMELGEYALRADAVRLGITPNNVRTFKQNNVCIPLDTPRTEAEKLICWAAFPARVLICLDGARCWRMSCFAPGSGHSTPVSRRSALRRKRSFAPQTKAAAPWPPPHAHLSVSVEDQAARSAPDCLRRRYMAKPAKLSKAAPKSESVEGSGTEVSTCVKSAAIVYT